MPVQEQDRLILHCKMVIGACHAFPDLPPPVKDAIRELQYEIKAIQGELFEPKPAVTADGVHVIPGTDAVWTNEYPYNSDGIACFSNAADFMYGTHGWYVSWGGPQHDAVGISDCYSTRALARQMRNHPPSM